MVVVSVVFLLWNFHFGNESPLNPLGLLGRKGSLLPDDLVHELHRILYYRSQTHVGFFLVLNLLRGVLQPPLWRSRAFFPAIMVTASSSPSTAPMTISRVTAVARGGCRPGGPSVVV
jgi:hypothetical protein